MGKHKKAEMGKDISEWDPTEAKNFEELTSMFGTLYYTMLTLAEIVTGGADWDRAVRPLIQEISVGTGVFLIVFISFVMLAILNVITGVVIDTAQGHVRQEELMLMADKICSTFDIHDSHSSRREIQLEEFENKLDTPAMKDYFEFLGIDAAQARLVFDLVDEDDRGI